MSTAGGTGTAAPRLADMDPAEARSERRRRDGRIPEGTLLVVGGQREVPADGRERRDLRRRLAELLGAYAELHDDLLVLSGLRPGAELLGGEAAVEAGVDWMAVLPWPDPQHHLRFADREAFLALRSAAPREVVLERKVPPSRADRAKALGRRDSWLAGAADLAVVVWDGDDADARAFSTRLERRLGDDVTALLF